MGRDRTNNFHLNDMILVYCRSKKSTILSGNVKYSVTERNLLNQ